MASEEPVAFALMRRRDRVLYVQIVLGIPDAVLARLSYIMLRNLLYGSVSVGSHLRTCTVSVNSLLSSVAFEPISKLI
jgi:hypothetical protein